MILKRFKANSFRNIENCDISFSDGTNLIFGNNAQGKTNAIEGIYLFARGRSFRSADDKDLKGFGSEGFRIYIEYEDKNGVNSLEYAFFGKDKKRKKNGYNLKGAKEMIGNFKAVLFYPDHLGLVKDSPEERRSFINIAIGQCYPFYIDCYSDYKEALENRNYLLKLASKGHYVDNAEIESWSDSLSEYASHIYLLRKEYIKKLEFYASKIMNEISLGKEDLSLFYKSDIKVDLNDREEVKSEYKKIFSAECEREKIVGSTLFGPHRDDIEILINGRSARHYASQGQQRSVVLSLKLAEGEVNREICGEYPVFLFDDVLSELDESRKKYILSGIKERQIIITGCENDSDIKAENIIEVSSGDFK
ncbi:MAG: DNA replication/repair protein RecF [Clostridia bacterium]|nr:DNA replication/repair protein RecF [Clostridia bacterium]